MIEWLWEILGEFGSYLSANFDPIRDAIDIAIVAFVVYWLLMLIRGTRAVQIVVGLVAIVAANVISEVFQLLTVRLILDSFIPYAVLIIVILFQNDIRRALARVGRGFFPAVSAEEASQILEEVSRAAQTLSKRRVGALIVFERETGLEDLIEGGTRLDAEVGKDLLVSIFHSQSPLHDGAVVIQQGRLAQAGAILPLSQRTQLPEGAGTRHRAAVGITEETDAVVVVVSEETASISLVANGEITRDVEARRLRDFLAQALSRARQPEPEAAEEPPSTDAPAKEAEDAVRAGSAG